MLSERQIEHLLKECEAKLEAPLATLRERLLHDRNQASGIFELVLLYILLGRFARVEPEAGPGMPDAIILGRWRPRVSLEPAVVTSPTGAELASSRDFESWLYQEIVKLGMPINGAGILTEAQPGDVYRRLHENRFIERGTISPWGLPATVAPGNLCW